MIRSFETETEKQTPSTFVNWNEVNKTVIKEASAEEMATNAAASYSLDPTFVQHHYGKNSMRNPHFESQLGAWAPVSHAKHNVQIETSLRESYLSGSKSHPYDLFHKDNLKQNMHSDRWAQMYRIAPASHLTPKHDKHARPPCQRGRELPLDRFSSHYQYCDPLQLDRIQQRFLPVDTRKVVKDQFVFKQGKQYNMPKHGSWSQRNLLRPPPMST